MSDNPWTVGSLFAGIGGIDLGLERTGHFRTAWFCERDPYCQRVLAKNWPDVPIFDDVTELGEGTSEVDVLAAGFPCQPVSHAGRRKAQDDERWLWPHVERLVRVLRPRAVLLENVPGLLTAGFDDVIGGLAACGYDAEWDCIPAAAVGAAHRRDRVFIVATPGAELRQHLPDAPRNGGWPSPMAYACGEGLERPNWQIRLEQRPGRGNNCGETMADASGIRRPRQGQPLDTGNPAQGEKGKTDQPVNGGIEGIWPTEPSVGRVADGVPRRMDRLRALGNAVVPQVAEYVGHRVAERLSVPVLS